MADVKVVPEPAAPERSKGSPAQSQLTLARLLAEKGPLAEPELVRIFLQVLGDLDQAHGQSMIHRDISPTRIVRDGSVWKLVDYGAGGVGAVRYMSPERGQGRLVDGRSDTYALGVCLYEAATGKVPFDSQLKYEILQAHANVPPPAPHSVRPEVSLDLERIIQRSLSKSPQARFQTAKEFKQALETLAKRHRILPGASGVQEDEFDARPEPVEDAGPMPAAQPAPRRFRPMLFIVIVAAALVGALALVFVPRRMSRRLPNVVGLDRARAAEQLRALGVNVTFAEAVGQGESGVVLAQEPSAGARLVPGAQVKLAVNTGNIRVPTVAGATLDDARQRIAAVGLVVSRVEEVFSDYYSAGMVTGSAPKAGSAVKRGEGVVLTIAAGRTQCPNCGARRESGARFCTKCGYQYGN
jgi:serine/threonine-protein kinase